MKMQRPGGGAHGCAEMPIDVAFGSRRVLGRAATQPFLRVLRFRSPLRSIEELSDVCGGSHVGGW